MSLITLGGKLLRVGLSLASTRACCCGCPCETPFPCVVFEGKKFQLGDFQSYTEGDETWEEESTETYLHSLVYRRNADITCDDVGETTIFKSFAIFCEDGQYRYQLNSGCIQVKDEECSLIEASKGKIGLIDCEDSPFVSGLGDVIIDEFYNCTDSSLPPPEEGESNCDETSDCGVEDYPTIEFLVDEEICEEAP